MNAKFQRWLIRKGWLTHQIFWYRGFAGVPGYDRCLRCGAPWKDLGLALDVDGPCPGPEFRREKDAETQKLWDEKLRTWDGN